MTLGALGLVEEWRWWEGEAFAEAEASKGCEREPVVLLGELESKVEGYCGYGYLLFVLLFVVVLFVVLLLWIVRDPVFVFDEDVFDDELVLGLE